MTAPEYVFKVLHFLAARLAGFAVIQKCPGISHWTCIHLQKNSPGSVSDGMWLSVFRVLLLVAACCLKKTKKKKQTCNKKPSNVACVISSVK